MWRTQTLYLLIGYESETDKLFSESCLFRLEQFKNCSQNYLVLKDIALSELFVKCIVELLIVFLLILI